MTAEARVAMRPEGMGDGNRDCRPVNASATESTTPSQLPRALPEADPKDFDR
jgi:hypothetical protein